MTTQINAWEQDPGDKNHPDGGPLIHRDQPDLTVHPFASKINVAPAPPVDNYAPGTAGFRYWACADALGRVASFWRTILPKTQKWNSHVGDSLLVRIDEGVDLNAYYDRTGLSFFHAAVGGRMVYSGESPDIVCHEFGHAVLDAIRPQLWDVAAFEPPAFHESFGDMSAILTALQLPSVRTAVLHDTANEIYRTSRLSRLAEQLGWAIRQKYPDAVDRDCLRNAVNSFFYQRPDDLPTSAPAGELSSEAHSFSRVFTGAFFQSLGLMFRATGKTDEATLQQVSVDMGKILISAIKHSPVVPEYFAQVAAHMVAAAGPETANGKAIRTAMLKHGILSAQGVAEVASNAAAVGAVAAAPQEDPAALPTQEIDVSKYGLTTSKIHVVCATQPKRFGIAGAAPNLGDARASSSADSALGFFEDLIRRGRLDHSKHVTAAVATVDVGAVKTHQLVEENGKVTLRRMRIDCGLRATPHQ